MTNPENHYMLGDSRLAGERLELLASAYSRAMRHFIESAVPRPPSRSLDLGCGPGHTTRLLHEASTAKRTTGIDASASYIEQARRNAPEGVDFVLHDLLQRPYPVPPAELVFSRFLLTHLAKPRDAIANFHALVADSGILLMQETSRLEASHPAFWRYYELLDSLQRHYGQVLFIGRELDRLVKDLPFDVVRYAERCFEQPARVMARLHALNLITWRRDPYAIETFDPAELDDLEKQLTAIADGTLSVVPLEVGLGEITLRSARY